MRIRFLRNKEYECIRTVIIDGIISVIDNRFFVEFGNVHDIQEYIIVNEDEAAIILSDSSICRIPLNEIELSDPQEFKASDCNCKKT